MAVIIGSARINEKGGITGGKAGDQKGGQEVSTQNWYLHKKGWVVLRPKSSAVAAKIAKNMKAACANNHIGYCQTHRTSLLNASKKYGYDVSKVTTDTEVDCSELVRICCLYAGVSVGEFNTSTLANVLVKTGKFMKLTTDKYCKKSAYLQTGDILVTKTKGHTVVVLSDGAMVRPVTDTSGYFDKYTGNTVSLIDGLKDIGCSNTSFAARTKIAVANGIENYAGTAAQNRKLLALLKEGKLKKAD